MVAVRREHAVDHRLGVAVDHLERGTQLVAKLLRELEAEVLRLGERGRGPLELGRCPLPPDLLTEQAREHLEQRLLVGGERPRLPMVEADRPEQRAVREGDVARAEGPDVPVDAEPLLEPQPLVPESGHLLRLRHGCGRLAGVNARAQAPGVRDRVVAADRNGPPRLERAEDVAAVGGDLGDDRDVDSREPLREVGDGRDRLAAARERHAREVADVREPDPVRHPGSVLPEGRRYLSRGIQRKRRAASARPPAPHATRTASAAGFDHTASPSR